MPIIRKIFEFKLIELAYLLMDTTADALSLPYQRFSNNKFKKYKCWVACLNVKGYSKGVGVGGFTFRHATQRLNNFFSLPFDHTLSKMAVICQTLPIRQVSTTLFSLVLLDNCFMFILIVRISKTVVIQGENE